MATKKKVKARKRTRKPDPRKINHVVIVLDKSGSMATMRQEAIQAFNQQIETIKSAVKGKRVSTKLTFVTFDTAPNEPLYFAAPLSKVSPLTEKDYVPSGMTAMLDAVGLTLSKLRDHEDFKRDTTTALVVVISDGQENNSKSWSWGSVAEMVKQLQDSKRWTFTYAGANQDLAVVSKNLNIPLGNTQQFAASALGYQAFSGSLNVSTTNYYDRLSKGFTQVSSFYNDTTTNTPTKSK